MSTLASRDHVYAIVLGLVAGYASWSRNPWWLSAAELVVLIAACEGVLVIAGGLGRRPTDNPHYPIVPRQVVAVLASIAVVILLGGLFFNIS